MVLVNPSTFIVCSNQKHQVVFACTKNRGTSAAWPLACVRYSREIHHGVARHQWPHGDIAESCGMSDLRVCLVRRSKIAQPLLAKGCARKKASPSTTELKVVNDARQ